MKFGRVEGFGDVVRDEDRECLHLRVMLETAGGLTVVRDDVVPVLSATFDAESLAWQVDQYTQETIGVDLATEGCLVQVREVGAAERDTASLRRQEAEENRGDRALSGAALADQGDAVTWWQGQAHSTDRRCCRTWPARVDVGQGQGATGNSLIAPDN